MIKFYPVSLGRDITRDHPLYIGHFFKLKGMHWRARRLRQGLIFSIAIKWLAIIKKNPKIDVGFIEEKTFLTGITQQVTNSLPILEHFFTIKRRGFKFANGNTDSTTIVPRKLGAEMRRAIEQIVEELRYCPPQVPTQKFLLQTQVTVQVTDKSALLQRLVSEARDDLLPPVRWLLGQMEPITFYYKPAGILQARDTSVWPIRAIETWPGWLRAALFGTVVDIDNAYCQFLICHLREKYVDSPRTFELLYPDLIAADADKHLFRREILELLRLDATAENLKLVKKLLMALANGSNISPLLILHGSQRSQAVRLIAPLCRSMDNDEIDVIGRRLHRIVYQFRCARRQVYFHLYKRMPKRINKKAVFALYFKWEREARHKIWAALGNTGLHLHDALEGVRSSRQPDDLERYIFEQTAVRVNVQQQRAAA